jgi:hypothetical protein
MKSKLAALVPVLILLTGCSLSGGDQPKKDLVQACELVGARVDTDNFIPNRAVEFFASAARANSEYLPLIQAAKLSQLPLFDFSGKENVSTLEVMKARSLIIGYCTPSPAK